MKVLSRNEERRKSGVPVDRPNGTDDFLRFTGRHLNQKIYINSVGIIYGLIGLKKRRERTCLYQTSSSTRERPL